VVRNNGMLVDPYGWYGAGADPCIAYAACEASVWLWGAELTGEFDFNPPDTAAPDRSPPAASIAVNPQPDLLFLAHFDGSPLPAIGAGMPIVAGAPSFEAAKFGAGARVAGSDRLAYPTAGNLRTDAGTIAFWAQLPENYPPTGNGRHYLVAASAHADEGPVYSGTLALRRDTLGPEGTARWDFWTTPEAGESARDDLAAPDVLAPGLHHFAITWDRASRTKALYLDGTLAAISTNAELPIDIGASIELGRWTPGANASGVTFDDLAIFGRALAADEIARLAAAAAPIKLGVQRVPTRDLTIAAKAIDDAGGIMTVQLGVNGVFSDPQPYEERYPLRLPEATGTYTVAARFFDRAGNSATVSATVELAHPPQPLFRLEDHAGISATLILSHTSDLANIEIQASPTADFAGAAWQPLPERLPWLWPFIGPHVIWVRFRDEMGLTSAPIAVGPSAGQIYLPQVGR
jgi:hypothetical protein